jgi:hypothetical protein
MNSKACSTVPTTTAALTERLRKAIKHLSQDSKQENPEYKSETLPLEPTCLTPIPKPLLSRQWATSIQITCN